MEELRTLGTSFFGQERISFELRRAVNLLERPTTSTVESLFRPCPKNSALRTQMQERDGFADPVQLLKVQAPPRNTWLAADYRMNMGMGPLGRQYKGPGLGAPRGHK